MGFGRKSRSDSAFQAEDGTGDSGGKVALLDQGGSRKTKARDQQNSDDALALTCLWVMSVIHQTTLSAANETSRAQVGRARWPPSPPQQGQAQVTGTCSRRTLSTGVTLFLAAEGSPGFVVLAALDATSCPQKPHDCCFLPPPVWPHRCPLPPFPPFLAPWVWKLFGLSFSWRREDSFS